MRALNIGLTLMLVTGCGAGAGFYPLDGAGGGSSSGGGHGAAGGSASAGGSAAGGTAGGPSVRRDQLFTSGSRLKVRFVLGDDGSRIQTGLYDTQMMVTCYFALAADGVTRCLPTTAVSAAYFGDAQCTTRVASRPPPACATPPPAFLSVSTDTCPSRTEIHRGGAQVSQAFAKSGASCTMVSLPGWEHFAVGARVDASQFLRGAEMTE